METKKLFLFVKILAFAGILLASYLLIEQVTNATNSICNISRTINCDAIISGAVSKTFGIPTPLIGLIGYIFILFGAITKNKKIILGMSAFGLVFCLWIAYRELFELRVICPLCIMCQLLMIAIFTLAVVLIKRKK